MDPEALAAWLTDLHCPDPAVREKAVSAIRQAGEEILPAVLKAFESEVPQTRADAGMALNVLAHPSTVPVLRQALWDEAWQIRQVAVWSLRAIGAPAIPALIDALCSEANTIGQVTQALAAIGDPAIQAGLDILGQCDACTRLQIVYVITHYAVLGRTRPLALLKACTRALLAL